MDVNFTRLISCHAAAFLYIIIAIHRVLSCVGNKLNIKHCGKL